MKAIITTVGKDQVGIIANVSNYLANNQVNIIDVSQTIMNSYFTMLMMVEFVDDQADIMQVSTDLAKLGTSLGVEINLRNAEIYEAMHRL